MKRKNLFEQMNRMKTLMNVRVLSEQTAALEKTAEELWNYAKRLFVRGGERTAEESIENALKKIESLVDRESKQYLESIVRNISRTGVANAEREFVEFLSKNTEIQRQIFRELETNFEQEVDRLITTTAKSSEIRNAFDELYSQALRYSGGDIEQAQNTLRNILKDELSDTRILEKYFDNVEAIEDNLGNWKIKSKGEPEITQNRPSVEETLENDPDIIENTDEATDELNRLYEENSGKPSQNIGQTYLPAWLRFYTKYWKNAFTNNKILQVKIEDKMKQIEAKLAKNPPEVVDVDMEDLYMLILGLRKSRTTDVTKTLNTLIMNNPKLRPEVKKLLQNDNIKTSWDALAQSEAKNTYGPVLEQTRAWAQSFPVTNFLEKVFSKEKFETKDWWKILFPNPKRLLQQIVWKDPRTNSEVVRALTQYGRNRAITSKIITFIVFQHGMIPAILAFMKTAGQNYKHWSSKADYAIAEELCETLKQLGQDCKGLPTVTPKPNSDDYWRYFKESLPFDYFGLHPYGEDGSLLKNAFFWTYLDEVIVALKDAGGFAMFGDYDESKLKNMFDLLEAKTQKKLEELGWDTNKSQEENLRIVRERIEQGLDPVVGDGLDISNAGDNEIYFTAWCLSKGKNKQSWVKDTNGNYGVTTDGIKWKYNKDTKGFDEIKESTTGENYTNDIPGFIKWFTEVKKMKLSQEDLPYIKSVGNNIYTFEDANGTIYKYEYSGTTFKDKTN